MNINHKLDRRIIFIIIFAAFSLQLCVRAVRDVRNDGMLGERLLDSAIGQGMALYSPYMLYANGGGVGKNLLFNDLPLVMFIPGEDDGGGCLTEYMQQYGDSYKNGYGMYAEQEQMDGPHGEVYEEPVYEEPVYEDTVQETEQEAVAENAETAETAAELAAGTFVPAQAPAMRYSEEQLRDISFLRKNFYAVDATTRINDEQLDYDTLAGFDASLKQDNSNVQILVYHTHSQEAYIDSNMGDPSTSIVAAGERLCEILRAQYGFNVLHHTGKYDAESRDYSYSNAMKGLNQVLAENPSIEVMIDLHRDQTNADTRLVTTVQDKKMAKFMFFNGLCYTRELGALKNLTNPYLQDNLSLSFQLQRTAEEYYPGITRRIYLKGYRYNLHFRPKSMLVELGSQTNTLEEAMNACGPLAHVIAMVLNGENKVRN